MRYRLSPLRQAQDRIIRQHINRRGCTHVTEAGFHGYPHDTAFVRAANAEVGDGGKGDNYAVLCFKAPRTMMRRTGLWLTGASPSARSCRLRIAAMRR